MCCWPLLLSLGLLSSLSVGLRCPERWGAAGMGDSCLAGDVLSAKGTGKASVGACPHGTGYRGYSHVPTNNPKTHDVSLWTPQSSNQEF